MLFLNQNTIECIKGFFGDLVGLSSVVNSLTVVRIMSAVTAVRVYHTVLAFET